MTSDEERKAALVELEQAIQKYVSTTEDEQPVLLRSWILVRETVVFNPEHDGQAAHKVAYTMSDGCGMGESIGLLEYAKVDVLDDMLWVDRRGDDD